MGIELPAELADIAQRTGTQWPKADEEAMQAQATAWREAAQSLRSLATDADASANGALQGMSGDAGDAARRTWGGFVDPDRGSFTAAARGADEAADRLAHASKQIGDGKVEIVRQLVDAARNEESARAAADGGHPGALLGVQNLLGAVSTNVASVTDSLVSAVADPARTLDPTAQANPHPGAHGQGSGGGLLNAVSGLTGDVVTSTTDAVVGREGVLPKAADTTHGLVHATTDTATGLVDRTTNTAGGLVDRTADTAVEAVDQGGRTAGEAVGGASRSVSDALDPGPSAAPEPSAGPQSSVVPEVVRDAAGELSPDAPTPPSGLAAGGGASGSFAEAVTPRSGIPIGSNTPAQPPGQTSLAGYADAPLPPAGPPPSAAPPLPGAAPPAQPGSAFGPFGGSSAAAPPGAAAPAAPGAPAAAPAARDDRAPQRPPAPDATQRPAPQQPPAHRAAPPAAPPPAPQHPLAQRPAPPAAPPPAPQQPQPEKQQPAAQPPMGSPRADRKSVVALFLVHMFPLGHLPRAAAEPARQLPAPAPDVDLLSAPRFEPHDHPNSHVFDDAIAMPDRAVDAPGLAPEHPAVAALLDVYDSLAGLHERDWDRRYLVKQDARSTEYAWPPGEVYPEGCLEDGEPVMLPPGALVDRFGDPHGRVFAADATPYHKRSLPPPRATPSLAGGPPLPTAAGEYRRYRVLRELPMWRGITASWFGQPGSGVRYRAVYPARDLVVLGYLEDITGEAPQAGGTA